MRSGWLLREDDVVCALELTDTLAERRRGLRGRPGCEGALHVPGRWPLSTVGMRFPLDVAMLSDELRVLAVARVAPRRIAVPRRGARSVLLTEAGCLERWGVRVGDQLEIREVP